MTRPRRDYARTSIGTEDWGPLAGSIRPPHLIKAVEDLWDRGTMEPCAILNRACFPPGKVWRLQNEGMNGRIESGLEGILRFLIVQDGGTRLLLHAWKVIRSENEPTDLARDADTAELIHRYSRPSMRNDKPLPVPDQA